MDEAKASLAERLNNANNVLVTVSRNPSVDQLSALLGLGLFLNKEGKHSAAVFSGEIPSTLEFLKPESTIQKNTDSLRDFIIALDKSKADKLRYKVEDDVVRIFITPYKSSIGQDDLEFSQGDFNVDVVVALGVSEQAELDEAIEVHGRILHDATVTSINIGANGRLGSINWNDPEASSLSELVTELIQAMNPDSLDEQIATALLTGIVAMTDRFSNDKTSAKTMSVSAMLMSAGANQQLVATKLEEPVAPAKAEPKEKPKDDVAEEEKKTEPGTLEIEHSADEEKPEDEPKEEAAEPLGNIELPEPEEKPEDAETETPEDTGPPAGLSGGPKLVTEAPVLGGTLTANSHPHALEPSTDPLSLPNAEQPSLLEHKTDTSSRAPFKPLDNLVPPSTPTTSSDLPSLTPPPSNWTAPVPPPAPPVIPPITPTEPPVAPLSPPAASSDSDDSAGVGQVHITENGDFTNLEEDGTLTQLEESVHSPHVEEDPTDAARAAITEAYASGPNNSLPSPSPALNSQPLGPDLHPTDSQTPPPVPPPFNPAAN
jgi:hypothetical protein